MATNLALDDGKIEAVRKLGGYRTKREAVTAALDEYIAHRRRLEALDVMASGEIELVDDFETVTRRARRGRARS